MRVQTGLQAQMCLGMAAACGASNPPGLPHRFGSRRHVVRGDEESGQTIDDDFLKAASAEGHNGGARGLSFGSNHAEGLLPSGRA
jgi:hypothetical protein